MELNHYIFYNKGFAFSSEIKTLLSLYDEPIEINKEALSEYLSLMYITAPNTIYKNIHKLKHGHFLIYEISKKIIIKDGINTNLNQIKILKSKKLKMALDRMH